MENRNPQRGNFPRRRPNVPNAQPLRDVRVDRAMLQLPLVRRVLRTLRWRQLNLPGDFDLPDHLAADIILAYRSINPANVERFGLSRVHNTRALRNAFITALASFGVDINDL